MSKPRHELLGLQHASAVGNVVLAVSGRLNRHYEIVGLIVAGFHSVSGFVSAAFLYESHDNTPLQNLDTITGTNIFLGESQTLGFPIFSTLAVYTISLRHRLSSAGVYLKLLPRDAAFVFNIGVIVVLEQVEDDVVLDVAPFGS